MTLVDWRMKGPEVSTCNCAWGCPCQFNALPTRGHCRAGVAMRIDEGHFGDVKLDGLKWLVMIGWPGAIHEGGGESQPVIDKAADKDQVDALLTILSGGETEPGATIFNVFSTVVDKIHDPLFLPIEFEADFAKRTARFAVEGLIEARTEPIKNPITGEPHFAKVTLPHGFEYEEAEYVSSTTKANGIIPLEWADSHGHLNMLHMTQAGVVH